MNDELPKGATLGRLPKWIRPVAIALGVVGLTLALTSTMTARPQHHRLHVINHTTSFVTSQKDPSVFAPGDQLFVGGTILRFESPHDQLGTFGISCDATGIGASELLCTGGAILADGKISIQMLIVQPDEPHRFAAITGGTGAYQGASGEAVGTTLNAEDEDAVFTFTK